MANYSAYLPQDWCEIHEVISPCNADLKLCTCCCCDEIISQGGRYVLN